jgi:tetratricopeptide (TPR) repeat protein
MQEVLNVGSSLQGFERYAPKFHYNQGIAAMYQGRLQEATQHFTQSEQLAADALLNVYAPKDRDDLRRDRISARYGIAVIKKDEKNYPDALAITAALHREIVNFAETAESNDSVAFHDLEASVRILEGHCYRDLGEYQKALDCYWSAHGILKSHRNWSHYYYVLLGLGRVYLAMGNPDRAQIFFDLISNAVNKLQLNALRQTLDQVSKAIKEPAPRLQVDRERKVIMEPKLGEVQFERRFVLLEIFYLLSAKPGHVFSKEDLVDQVWRETYNPMIHDSKVYTSISRLRKLIEPDFKRPMYVLNERDGYSFNPTVVVEEARSQRRQKVKLGELGV